MATWLLLSLQLILTSICAGLITSPICSCRACGCRRSCLLYFWAAERWDCLESEIHQIMTKRQSQHLQKLDIPHIELHVDFAIKQLILGNEQNPGNILLGDADSTLAVVPNTSAAEVPEDKDCYPAFHSQDHMGMHFTQDDLLVNCKSFSRLACYNNWLQKLWESGTWNWTSS